MKIINETVFSALESVCVKAFKKSKDQLHDPSLTEALDFPEAKKLWVFIDGFDQAYQSYIKMMSAKDIDDSQKLKFIQQMEVNIEKLVTKAPKYLRYGEYREQLLRIKELLK